MSKIDDLKKLFNTTSDNTAQNNFLNYQFNKNNFAIKADVVKTYEESYDHFKNAFEILKKIIGKVQALRAYALASGLTDDAREFKQVLEVLDAYLDGYRYRLETNLFQNLKSWRNRVKKFFSTKVKGKNSNYEYSLSHRTNPWSTLPDDVKESNLNAFIGGLNKQMLFKKIGPGYGTVGSNRQIRDAFQKFLEGNWKEFIKFMRKINEQLLFCLAGTERWLPWLERFSKDLSLDQLEEKKKQFIEQRKNYMKGFWKTLIEAENGVILPFKNKPAPGTPYAIDLSSSTKNWQNVEPDDFFGQKNISWTENEALIDPAKNSMLPLKLEYIASLRNVSISDLIKELLSVGVINKIDDLSYESLPFKNLGVINEDLENFRFYILSGGDDLRKKILEPYKDYNVDNNNSGPLLFFSPD